MGHIARTRARDLDNAEITEDELRKVAWRAPPGWIKPHWFKDEPCLSSLPMTKDRLEWCLAVSGWPLNELAFCVHAADASVRQ